MNRIIGIVLCISLCFSLPGGLPAQEIHAFPLDYSGTTFPIYYEDYGTFINGRTNRRRFKINKLDDLREAVGLGIFPSKMTDLKINENFMEWLKNKPEALNPWDYVSSGDPQADFFVWSYTKSVKPGVKLFYQAQALAEAGHIEAAIKAYYALFVHFPKTHIWSADKQFVWYPAGKALGEISTLTKAHPDVSYRLVDAEFKVINGKDIDLRNDRFVVKPGHWEPFDSEAEIELTNLKIVNRRGRGRVQLIQYENKHWQMLVDGKLFFIKGMSYAPTPVGKHISDGEGNLWMFSDINDNGTIDGPFESWIDENKNGVQDEDEESVGDFELMRRMGVNAIRLYRHSKELSYNPKEFNKPLLRELRREYGISVMMGDFLGAYTTGSGATWAEGTDYTDKTQLRNMKKLVKKYVLDHRKEPYVLMWVLGNENLMPSDYSGVNATRTLASEQVEAYLTFVNEIAEMIHKLDPDHPVAVGNLALHNVEEHSQYAPDVDIFGTNVYLGSSGMGDMWSQIQKGFDRPVLVTEFGCDAYNSRDQIEDEKAQANYHKGNWNDIILNSAGKASEGNAIGGVVFAYLDEWWKSSKGSWSNHDTAKDSAMAFPDGWANEEWFGVFSQGDGENSPFLRERREVYDLYQKTLWAD